MAAEGGWKPLAKCRVLYIGSAVSPTGPTGMGAIQDPLNERLPHDVTSVQGIDAWLYAHDQGLQLQYIHDKNVVFFPIRQLYVCAAVRRLDGQRFVELDSAEAAAANGSPPVFALVMKRDNLRECHGFICKSNEAALALVQSCQYAYKEQQAIQQAAQVPTPAPSAPLPLASVPAASATLVEAAPTQGSRAPSQVVERVIYHTEPQPASQLVQQPTYVQQPQQIVQHQQPIMQQQIIQQPTLPQVQNQASVPEHGYFYTANEALIRNYNLAGPPKPMPKDKSGITVENVQTEGVPNVRYEPKFMPYYQPTQPQHQVFQIEVPAQQQIEAPPVQMQPVAMSPAPLPIEPPPVMQAPMQAPMQPVFIVPPPPPSQRMVVEEWRTVSSSSSSSSSEDQRDEIGQIVEEVMRRRAEKKKTRSRGFGTRESDTVYRTAAGFSSRQSAPTGLPRYDNNGRGSYDNRRMGSNAGPYGFRRSDAQIY